MIDFQLQNKMSFNGNLIRLDDSVKYQRMKNISGIGTEYPAQVGQAHTAKADSPAVTCKPAELIRGLAGIPATGDIFEASDLKNNPVWIGKGVLV